MGALIGWAAKAVGQRYAPFLVYGGLVLLVVLALWAWGRSRYNEGVSDTDAKWEEAGRRLQRQAEQSANKADQRAAGRIEVQNQRVAQERERLDAAEQNGSSPLDVLFGG